MEEHRSSLHGKSGPPFECNRRDQEVYVLLIKYPRKLFVGENFLWFKRLSAYVLDFVLSEVQNRGNYLVRCKLICLFGRLSSSEPDQKCSRAECSHHVFIHSLIFHYLNTIITSFYQLIINDQITNEMFITYQRVARLDQF